MEYLQSDEYLAYLKKNCGVRGFDIDERTPVSTRPDVDITLRYARGLGITPGEEVLEVGCGVGRILKELHDEFQVLPHGIDPVPMIIDAARERVAAITSSLEVAAAEAIPYQDDTFDAVLCWGVFDLTDQAVSLKEMARVIKSGGLLLLTGKNDDYPDDDSEALLAEEAARRKGIPNHFTDWAKLVELAGSVGLRVLRRSVFERRGDFMRDQPLRGDVSRFYEYAVVFRKHATGRAGGPVEIASLRSKTFDRVRGSIG